MNPIFPYQDKVLTHLANQIDDFYLAGGTALAKFYFKHRESYDLDFFTKEYSTFRIEEIAGNLSKNIKKMKLTGDQKTKKMARLRIYEMVLDKDNALKIDFVEDVFDLLKPLKKVNGINILSQEDIYLRKIYAVGGSTPGQDRAGKKQFMGGRQEARDLYDLYILSTAFQNLSLFMEQYCEDWVKEAVIIWFRSFNRIEMKMGLIDIRTENKIEFKDIDRHFKNEIDRLIGKMISS